MMVARRTRGAGVHKPTKDETAGDVTKLRVRRYGDLDAGGLLPGCVDRLSGKQSTGRRAVSASRDRQNRRPAAEIERQDGCSGCARASLIIAGQEAAIQKGRAGVSPRIDFDHDVSILITAVDTARRGAALECLDDDHAAAAAKARVREFDVLGATFIAGLVLFRRHVEQAACNVAGARAAGEQAVVADAVEARRQDVDQESADELGASECHDLLTVASLDTIVLPSEGDTAPVAGATAILTTRNSVMTSTSQKHRKCQNGP
jgi:hypothetical protein